MRGLIWWAWYGGPDMGGLIWGSWYGGPGMGGLAWYGENVPNLDRRGIKKKTSFL